MRFLIAFFFMLFMTNAAADSDSGVMDMHRQYLDAVENGNNRDIRRYAKAAYEEAEAAWGDSRKDTGRLAMLYADALLDGNRWRRALKLYQRCQEILQTHDDTLQETLRCRVGEAGSYQAGEKIEEAASAAFDAIAVAEPLAEEEPWAAYYAGEAYLQLAALAKKADIQHTPRGTIASGESSSRLGTKVITPEVDTGRRTFAVKAVSYLEASGQEPTMLFAQAYRLAGNYAEADEDYPAAERHYDKAYDVLKTVLGEDDPAAMRMQGMAAYVRTYTLARPVEREPTRKPSDYECMIAVRGELEIEYCVDLRIAPYFPNEALYKGQQGFALTRYDINREGRVENVRIVHSWPGGIFDERAVKAVQKWRYTSPNDQHGNIVRISDVETQVTFRIK